MNSSSSIFKVTTALANSCRILSHNSAFGIMSSTLSGTPRPKGSGRQDRALMILICSSDSLFIVVVFFSSRASALLPAPVPGVTSHSLDAAAVSALAHAHAGDRRLGLGALALDLDVLRRRRLWMSWSSRGAQGRAIYSTPTQPYREFPSEWIEPRLPRGLRPRDRSTLPFSNLR